MINSSILTKFRNKLGPYYRTSLHDLKINTTFLITNKKVNRYMYRKREIGFIYELLLIN